MPRELAFRQAGSTRCPADSRVSSGSASAFTRKSTLTVAIWCDRSCRRPSITSCGDAIDRGGHCEIVDRDTEDDGRSFHADS